MTSWRILGARVAGLAGIQGRGGITIGAPVEWTGDVDHDRHPADGRMYVGRTV